GGTLRVYCEECGEPVEDAGLAMYAWDGNADAESEHGAIPYILHKVPCSDAFQEKRLRALLLAGAVALPLLLRRGGRGGLGATG
ncbi:hypothetical protein, partial [Pandoraea pneumonica]|uniref:hypothetical protein n=1 Tax=Pandoraea pneumonica TaxID=2508299 RepID=UPI003CF0EC2E